MTKSHSFSLIHVSPAASKIYPSSQKHPGTQSIIQPPTTSPHFAGHALPQLLYTSFTPHFASVGSGVNSIPHPNSSETYGVQINFPVATSMS